MSIKPHEKIGKGRVLADVHGKHLVSQNYRNPKTGKTEEWGIFSSNSDSSVILPITPDKKVVSIKQFRHGADRVILELPSGNINSGESPAQAVERELLEETGYQAKQIIPLSSQEILIEQAGYNTNYFGFLGLGCTWKTNPKLDENEDIEVVLIDLKDWIHLMFNASIKVNSDLALTFLALPHLGLFSPPKEAKQCLSL